MPHFNLALWCNLSTDFLGFVGTLPEPLVYSGRLFISTFDFHNDYTESICHLCRLLSMTTIPQLRRMAHAVMLQPLSTLYSASGYVASSSEEEYKDPSHPQLPQEQQTPIRSAVTDAVLIIYDKLMSPGQHDGDERSNTMYFLALS